MRSAFFVYVAAALSFATILYQASCPNQSHTPFFYIGMGSAWPAIGALTLFKTLSGQRISGWGEGCRD